MRTSKRLTPTLLAVGAAALLGAACGDDDGGGGDPDARPADASTPDGRPVDAAPPTPTRSGTLAFTEVKLASAIDEVNALAIGGAAISIAFEDLTTGGGNVVINTGTPGCTVEVFDCPTGLASCPFRPEVDVGPIMITNGAMPGITGAVPPACAFTGGEYRCPVNMRADLTGTIAIAGGVATFKFPAQTFAANLRGTWVNVSGLEGPLAPFNNTYPVISAALGEDDEFQVAVPGIPDRASTPITPADLLFLQGVGPVPGGANPAAPVDFLADMPATEQFRVQFTGSADNRYPAGLDVTLGPAGAGMTLGTTNCATCKQPFQMPTSIADDAAANGTAVSFSCDTGQGGTCGPDGSGVINGLVFSGTASNGDLEGLQPFEMPTEGVTKVVSFSCSALAKKIDIRNDVMKAILAIAPTRIETRILRVTAATPTDQTTKNELRVLAGHGIVGHTDVPPPPPPP